MQNTFSLSYRDKLKIERCTSQTLILYLKLEIQFRARIPHLKRTSEI